MFFNAQVVQAERLRVTGLKLRQCSDSTKAPAWYFLKQRTRVRVGHRVTVNMAAGPMLEPRVDYAFGTPVW